MYWMNLVARKTGQTSKFGGFLDSTLDRISDSVIVLGLIWSGEMIWPWDFKINCLIGFISMGTMLLISYTRSRAEIEGVIMKGIGFMERAETRFHPALWIYRSMGNFCYSILF